MKRGFRVVGRRGRRGEWQTTDGMWNTTLTLVNPNAKSSLTLMAFTPTSASSSLVAPQRQIVTRIQGHVAVLPSEANASYQSNWSYGIYRTSVDAGGVVSLLDSGAAAALNTERWLFTPYIGLSGQVVITAIGTTEKIVWNRRINWRGRLSLGEGDALVSCLSCHTTSSTGVNYLLFLRWLVSREY